MRSVHIHQIASSSIQSRHVEHGIAVPTFDVLFRYDQFYSLKLYTLNRIIFNIFGYDFGYFYRRKIYI